MICILFVCNRFLITSTGGAGGDIYLARDCGHDERADHPAHHPQDARRVSG